MTATARAEVLATVRAVVADILPGLSPADSAEHRHLADLGADSVDRVEIIIGLLHRLGLREPMSSFSSPPNVGALVDLLVAKGAALPGGGR